MRSGSTLERSRRSFAVRCVDNDVLMISEFDDAETARAAIAAAETGRIVISSMRTSDPADTIDRIVSLFPEPQQRVVRGRLAGGSGDHQPASAREPRQGQVAGLEVLTNNERVKSGSLVAPMRSSLVDIAEESSSSACRRWTRPCSAW